MSCGGINMHKLQQLKGPAMIQKLKNSFKISTVIAVLALSASNATAKDMDHSDHSMTMHHIHLMLNHAVEMAANGSNLVMTGEMGMAGEIDTISIHHGKAMIANAKGIIEKVMKGESMESMHMKGINGTNDMMQHTHDMSEAALNYINLIEGMSTEKLMKMDMEQDMKKEMKHH